MPKKSTTTIGIEYDSSTIRAARVTSTVGSDSIEFSVDSLEEEKGTFDSDGDVIKGLKSIKSRISPGPADKVVSCLNGKQIFATVIQHRRLPDNELRNALRFVMRKNLPFEVAGSTIDYQIISSPDNKSDKINLLVSVASNTLLHKHVNNFEKAGLKPDIVDLFPVAIINSFWAGLSEQFDAGIAHAVMHIGPSLSTLAFDGVGLPYFTRSIYFDAQALFGNGRSVDESEKSQKLELYAEEIVRSLSFYEKTYKPTHFSSVYLLGEFAHSKELLEYIVDKVGIEMRYNLLMQKLGCDKKAPIGTFDIPLALSMRQG
ncbi:MAG: hypothetical protein GF398_12655 [Chitinivibrionales bacterium]|nr:hypothetical protein [Chitinivibrionales bacterium]